MRSRPPLASHSSANRSVGYRCAGPCESGRARSAPRRARAPRLDPRQQFRPHHARASRAGRNRQGLDQQGDRRAPVRLGQDHRPSRLGDPWQGRCPHARRSSGFRPSTRPNRIDYRRVLRRLEIPIPPIELSFTGSAGPRHSRPSFMCSLMPPELHRGAQPTKSSL